MADAHRSEVRAETAEATADALLRPLRVLLLEQVPLLDQDFNFIGLCSHQKSERNSEFRPSFALLATSESSPRESSAADAAFSCEE